MMELTPGEIHLWLAFHDEIAGKRPHAGDFMLLDEQERLRYERFRFARDRLRYLTTRSLVRNVLSRYAAIEPRDWRFEANPYGRPRVANPEIGRNRLCFSISHTRGLIVVGVTGRRELGVDVENICDRAAPISIADRFFASEEIVALAGAPREQQQDRFFEYWTFKESYIKARGMGLSIPLDKFSFHYPDDQIVEIAIEVELGDDPRRWQFWQLRPAPEYIIAVCAERCATHVSELVVRTIASSGGEQTLCPVVRRRSA